MKTPTFPIGALVTMTNDYGVKFTGKTVVGWDDPWPSNPEPRYFLKPTDTPWYSFPESSLTPEEA